MRLSALLKNQGFPQFQKQQQIPLENSAIPYTKPDFFYEDDIQSIRIAIYLDGLSRDIHGNEETRRRDYFIRTSLRSMGVSVIEIPASSLDDPQLMRLHLKEIGLALGED